MSVSKQEKDVAPFYGGIAHPLKPLGSVAFFLANRFFNLSNDMYGRAKFPLLRQRVLHPA
jgi:hypothetical protein